MEALVRSLLEHEYKISIDELDEPDNSNNTNNNGINTQNEAFHPPLPPPSITSFDNSRMDTGISSFSSSSSTSVHNINSSSIGTSNDDINNAAHQIAETAFCQITQCTAENAKFYLSACDYDLNAAVTMYMESPPDSVPDTNTLPEPPAVRQPLASIPVVSHFSHTAMSTEDGITTESMSFNRFSRFHRGMQDDDDEDIDYDFTRPPGSPRGAKVDRFDAEGIRLPDDVVRRRLLNGMESRNDEFFEKEEEDDGIEWMTSCEPPKSLKFPGSFQGAKSLSLNDKKWLMVNIQNHEEFSSHMLNRDTWSNEMIDSMVRSSFTFWQRNYTSQEAQSFMNTYAIGTADLPMICIVDPRTSAKTLTLKGFVSPDDLCVALVEFLEENNLNSSAAVKVRGMSFDGPKANTTEKSNLKSTNNNSNALNVSSNSSNSSSSPYTYDDSMSANSSFQSLLSESSPLVSAKTSESNNSAIPGPVEFRRINSKSTSALNSNIDDIDFGNVPDEPSNTDDTVTISIKLLPPNKPVKRSYKKTDKAKCLFAVVIKHFPEAKTKAFDLCAHFPTRNLSNFLDQPLGTLDLDNAMVAFKWA